MAPSRKVPLRVCAGCMEKQPKKSLVRIVRTPEGEVLLDETGKKSGRGVYICPSGTCLQKARKGKRLEKALRKAVTPDIYDTLSSKIDNK